MIKCRLKTILREHNLTQKDLCTMINARPSTICNLCNDNAEGVKFQLLEDICRILECEITDILFIS